MWRPIESSHDAILTAAINEQEHVIGWKAFHRGCMGKWWGEAYCLITVNNDDHSALLWLSEAIHLVIEYTMKIWEVRNGILHERNEKGVEVRVLQELRDKVRLEYAACEEDKFIISRSQSYLFEIKTLQQQMNQDRDTLSCWLTEVADARDAQKRFRERAANAAKQFFHPRRKEEEKIQYATESSSMVSTMTYVTHEWVTDTSIETKEYVPYATQITADSTVLCTGQQFKPP